jgi:hypothetical protein
MSGDEPISINKVPTKKKTQLKKSKKKQIDPLV